MKKTALWILLSLMTVSLSWAQDKPAQASSDETPASTLSPEEQEAITQAVNEAVSEKLASTQSPSGVKVDIHGFAELDMIGDDTQSFKETVGNAPVVRPGATAGDNGETQFSPRNSRLSFLAQVPDMDGWKNKGYLELDFLGYDPAPNYTAAATNAAPVNSEAAFYSQPGIRIRHAYVDAQKDGWEILAGQAWTIFGWQADYLLGTMTPGAAVMGELFQRTPQVRVMKTFGDDTKLQIALSADRPEEAGSEVPNFDGGLRLVLGSWKGRFASPTGPINAVPFSLGISGTLRDYTYGTAGPNVNLNQSAKGQAIAFDALIPVVPNATGDGPSLVLTGEWTAGKGDGDEMLLWNGGLPALSTTANGLNLDPGVAGFDANNNLTLVDIQSWNGQAQFHFSKDMGIFLTVGYGEVFSDNLGGLASGAAAGKLYNDGSVIFANLVHDFNTNIRAGLEYDRFDTHYVTGPAGTGSGSDAIDHRVMVSSWYRF